MSVIKEGSKWVSISYIADYFEVDYMTVMRDLQAGRIPYIKVNRTYRVKRSWLEARQPGYANEEGWGR